MKIRPGWRARVARSANSVGVRSIGRPADLGPHPRHVERQVAGPDPSSAGRSAGVDAAQDRPDPGDELARAERLGQVVVGAELEAEQLVQLVVAGGEHDHRQVRVAPDRRG